MNLLLFLLLGVIAILIAYIVVRENIYRSELEEIENESCNAEIRAVTHFRKLNQIEMLIKEEQNKPIYARNNFMLISKIKEVIISGETK